jgi:mannose-6-phosphate isomerase
VPGDIEAALSPLQARLERAGLTVVDQDLARPWGGFVVLGSDELERFLAEFFADAEPLLDGHDGLQLSPKLLLVAPGRRLSWQYHRRRAEIWRVLDGPVGVCRGPHDEQPAMRRCEAGQLLRFEFGERHRLIGLERWGSVAEIWQHADPEHPSDEHDIVRLQDDFGRV